MNVVCRLRLFYVLQRTRWLREGLSFSMTTMPRYETLDSTLLSSRSRQCPWSYSMSSLMAPVQTRLQPTTEQQTAHTSRDANRCQKLTPVVFPCVLSSWPHSHKTKNPSMLSEHRGDCMIGHVPSAARGAGTAPLVWPSPFDVPDRRPSADPACAARCLCAWQPAPSLGVDAPPATGGVKRGAVGSKQDGERRDVSWTNSAVPQESSGSDSTTFVFRGTCNANETYMYVSNRRLAHACTRRKNILDAHSALTWERIYHCPCLGCAMVPFCQISPAVLTSEPTPALAPARPPSTTGQPRSQCFLPARIMPSILEYAVTVTAMTG